MRAGPASGSDMATNPRTPMSEAVRRRSALPGLLAGLLGFASNAPAQEPASPQEPRPAAGAVPPAAAGQWTPSQDLSVQFEGALVDTRNGDGFIETPGYRKLLEEVRSWPESDFNGRALVRLDYDAAMADPDSWRGRLVTVRGILVDLRAERLERPIWDQIDVYRAIVTESDGSEGVICDLLGAPPHIELPDVKLRDDVVDIEGVLYRTVHYENKQGQIKEAPYLIAKRIRIPDLADASRSTKKDLYGMVLIGAALAFVTFRLTLALQQRRRRSRREPARTPGFHGFFRERLRTLPPRRGPPRA